MTQEGRFWLLFWALLTVGALGCIALVRGCDYVERCHDTAAERSGTDG